LTIASWLPWNRVVVKTSRTVKGKLHVGMAKDVEILTGRRWAYLHPASDESQTKIRSTLQVM
jgi:hypothetical protein